jgi:phosphoribosylglycinamide formyltransferase-1
MKKIAIFASGSGSNAQNIIEYFTLTGTARVEIILTNNKDAYVLQRAKKYQIRTCIFTREEFYKTEIITNILKDSNIDLIVLAGFLWLIPSNLLKIFPNKIINIHPALLPKFGGKGMYGNKVHEAVISGGEKFSGITIHYINENYDEGDIICQEKVEILPTDSPETLAQKIHLLEYEFFPKTIEKLLMTNLKEPRTN